MIINRLLIETEPERREARLPGRDVAVAAHLDLAAVPVRRRRGDVTNNSRTG